MRLAKHLILENWAFPSDDVMKDDFSEYKKKENSKWEGRARRMGFRFPIFPTFDDFKQALKDAKVVELTKEMDNKIQNRSQTGSIEGLKNLVSSYVRPRDVDRIVQGLNSEARLPMPIILRGKHGMWIMAGNTRLDSAFILGKKPKVLMVDVSE
jgi:hypothetical protein